MNQQGALFYINLFQ